MLPTSALDASKHNELLQRTHYGAAEPIISSTSSEHLQVKEERELFHVLADGTEMRCRVRVISCLYGRFEKATADILHEDVYRITGAD